MSLCSCSIQHLNLKGCSRVTLTQSIGAQLGIGHLTIDHCDEIINTQVLFSAVEVSLKVISCDLDMIKCFNSIRFLMLKDCPSLQVVSVKADEIALENCPNVTYY